MQLTRSDGPAKGQTSIRRFWGLMDVTSVLRLEEEISGISGAIDRAQQIIIHPGFFINGLRKDRQGPGSRQSICSAASPLHKENPRQKRCQF
jgi:hypothetical protein